MLFDFWYIMSLVFCCFFEERGTVMFFLHHRPNQGALRHAMAERDPAKGPEVDTSGIYDTSLSYSSEYHKRAAKAKRQSAAAMTPANRNRTAGK